LGTARSLAVAARTLRHLLWIRTGFAGTGPALAGAEAEARSKKLRMIAPLAKFSDWFALQAASMLWTFRKSGNSKLTEAIEFLNGPNFIPAESKPAQLGFKSKIHFTFLSPQPCEFAENNVVHGRLYRRTKDWQRFPTLILLHGGGDSLNHRCLITEKSPDVKRGFVLTLLTSLTVFHHAAQGAAPEENCRFLLPLAAGAGGLGESYCLRTVLSQTGGAAGPCRIRW